MNTFSGSGLEPSAWLAAIVEGSQDAIVSKSLEGTILSWNGAAQKLFGYSAQEAIGQPITLIIPQDRLHEEDTIIANIRAGRRTEHFETLRRRKDGSLVDVSLTISPVRDAHGQLLGASKVARDITQARQMAKQQQLLLQEMKHRIKNLFTLATSLVALCRREAQTVDEMAEALHARLVALARAHDMTVLPTRQDGSLPALRLRDLLATILQPYESASGARIDISGEDMLIGPRSLVSAALLLHELATNSAKYGALGKAFGVLAITMNGRGDSFHLSWGETGFGAPLPSPQTSGFGSKLETMALRALGGTIHRDWQADCLLIDISFDKASLGT